MVECRDYKEALLRGFGKSDETHKLSQGEHPWQWIPKAHGVEAKADVAARREAANGGR